MEKIAYTLYHGENIMSDSVNLVWIKVDAMDFHRSKWACDVFVMPRKL